MADLKLDASSTALVLIDLQNGIMGRPMAPHTAADVLAKASSLAGAVRSAGGVVVYVHVDFRGFVPREADVVTMDPKAPPPPPSAMELAPGCGIAEGDVQVVKRSWGAFHATDLDLHLRRRNVRTIILGGVATNIGVESTARAAFDREYNLVFAEDAMATILPEAHDFAIKTIFPRMGKVRSTQEIVDALKASGQ